MFSKKGFTLLEILVAITIFSIAIALVSYSFRHSINIVKYVNFSYAEDLQKLSRLRDSIASTFFFLTQDDTKIDTPGKVFNFFFKGSPKSLEYITCKPVIVEDREIVISRIRKEKNNLILEEYPVYDRNINYKQPSLTEIKPKKIIIVPDIRDISFSYFYEGKRVQNIEKKIPTSVEMKILKIDRKKPEIYVFKLRSDAYIKKILGESVYEQF
jgi:prepilin-type N-terminal cleavage/methylation domain-containing protein